MPVANHVARRRSLSSPRWVVLVALPIAAVGGAVASRGSEPALVLGVALSGVIVTSLGLLSTRPDAIARLVLWGGLLISLGVKPPRRTDTEVAAQPITMLNLMPVLALVIAIGVALVLTRPRLLPLAAPERWLGVFLAVAVGSSAWSIAPLHSLLRSLTLVATYAAVVLLARSTLERGTDPIRTLNILVHLLVGSVLLALIISPGAATAPLPGAAIPIHRLKGLLPYIHPNALAFLAAVGVLLVWRATAAVALGARWWGRLLAITIDVGVLLATRTRSALAYLVLAVALWLLLDGRNRRRLVITVPAAAALVFAALQLIGPLVVDFVARDQNARQLTSLTGRTEEWARTLELVATSPLIGHGYYAGHRFGQLAALEGSQNTTTDNAWVDVAIDLGALGLVPFAGFVTSGATALFRAHRRGASGARVAVVLFAVCATASAVNPSLNESNYWMLVWSWLILAVGPALCARTPPKNDEDDPGRWARFPHPSPHLDEARSSP